MRDAGLPVELRVEGEPRELPPGVDVSAYRIVQEALTNALKHAGPGAGARAVRYGADALELEIADDGAGAANGGGGGHGLARHARAGAVFGGELDERPAARAAATRSARRLPL